VIAAKPNAHWRLDEVLVVHVVCCSAMETSEVSTIERALAEVRWKSGCSQQ
jgi:hypothetical protein